MIVRQITLTRLGYRHHRGQHLLNAGETRRTVNRQVQEYNLVPTHSLKQKYLSIFPLFPAMGFLHNVLESPSLIRSYRNHSISLFQSKIGFGNVITSLGIHLVPLCLDRKYDLARVQRRSDQVSVWEIKRCREIGEGNTAGVARLSRGSGWGAPYSQKCLHLRFPRAGREMMI